MATINKANFKTTYGIDDDIFVNFLMQYKTFKNIVSMLDTSLISIEDMKRLYHRYQYFYSICIRFADIKPQVEYIVKDILGKITSFTPKIILSGNKYNANQTIVTMKNGLASVRFSIVGSSGLTKNTTVFDNLPVALGLKQYYNHVVYEDTYNNNNAFMYDDGQIIFVGANHTNQRNYYFNISFAYEL